MEFCEKLQELRKNRGLTQEELAEQLYVSRTAISKWESGRGYPSIDSLKAIAKYFSVSVDDLLSSDTVLAIAEEDRKRSEKHSRTLVFGLLDCSAGLLLFLPFFCIRSNNTHRQFHCFLSSLLRLIQNRYSFHALTGVHWTLYILTDWLGLVPIGIAFGFAILGLVQLIRRKSLLKVDRDILILGSFYIVVLAAYLLFETVVINFRPVLIDGKLEASYPSSMTMLALCILPTAMMQSKTRIRGDAVRRAILGIFVAFTVFMVVGWLLSGVHWLSDIVGGVLLSAGLVPLYALAVKQRENA